MKRTLWKTLVLGVICLSLCGSLWAIGAGAADGLTVVYEFDCSEAWVESHTEGVDYKGVKFGTSADLKGYYFIKYNQITLGENYIHIGEYDLSKVDLITFDVTNGGESVFKAETKMILAADKAGKTVLAEFDAIDGTGWSTPVTSSARVESDYSGPVYAIFRNAGATDGYQVDRFRFYAIDESGTGAGETETLPDDGHSLPCVYRFTGSPAWFYALGPDELQGVDGGVSGADKETFYLKFNMKTLDDNFVYIGDYDLSGVQTLTYLVTNGAGSTFSEAAALILSADREGREVLCTSAAIGRVGWNSPRTVMEFLDTDYSGPIYLSFRNGGATDGYQVADLRFYGAVPAGEDITILPPAETTASTETDTPASTAPAVTEPPIAETTVSDETTAAPADDAGCGSSLAGFGGVSLLCLMVGAIVCCRRTRRMHRRTAASVLSLLLATLLCLGACTPSGTTEETAGGTDPATGETESVGENEPGTVPESPSVSRDLLTFTPASPEGQVLTEKGNSPQILIHNYNESAIDALGRPLPTSAEAGLPKEGKYVGLFYFIWASEGGTVNTNRNVTNILACNPDDPDFAGIGTFHWWAMPETGYRRSSDEWIIKRDMYYFSMAGVDFIYLDFTNGYLYENGLTTLLDTCLEMRAEGQMTPYIVPWTIGSRNTTIGQRGDIGDLYEQYYKNEKYDDLWFRWEGKPLAIIRHDENDLFPVLEDPEMTDYFSFRIGWSDKQWPGKPQGYGKWDDNHVVNYGYAYGWWESRRAAECVAIGTAGFANYGSGRSGELSADTFVDKFGCTDTMGEGLVLEAAFREVMERNPETQVLLLSRWNESGAQYYNVNDFGFVDQFSPEFSRDMEPVKGLFGDNYFYQMCSIIRRFKGVLPADGNTGSVTIDIAGDFSAWQSVKPVFTDFAGDTSVRDDYDTTGTIHYVNKTGRNDIVESRLTADGGSLYVYAKTAEAITKPEGVSNWMLLLLDTDNSKATGFEGYDILINDRVIDETTTTLSVWRDGLWQEVASLSYKVSDSELMVAIPRALIGLDGEDVTVNLHWLDNVSDLYDLDAWFTTGDSAPERRNNYAISLAVPYDASVEANAPAAAPEAERLCFMPAKPVSPEALTPGLAMTYYPLPADYGVQPVFDHIGDLAAVTAHMPGIHAGYGNRYADYALLFEGYVKVPSDDTYTFSLICDDGARLYIDGRLVVDGSYVKGTDTAGTARTYVGCIRLAAGCHTVRVEYAECVGNGGAYLDVKCDKAVEWLSE